MQEHGQATFHLIAKRDQVTWAGFRFQFMGKGLRWMSTLHTRQRNA
jgi:hypothetical protein